MWHEITYPFPNFNGATVDVEACINNFIPHFIMGVIIYPWWDCRARSSRNCYSGKRYILNWVSRLLKYNFMSNIISNISPAPSQHTKNLSHVYDHADWWSLLRGSPVSPFHYWCAILIAHQIVMAKHGGSCVHFSGISTCGRTSRETVSHPQCPPLPTLCKISLPIYVIVTNKLLQPLTTTWYDSLVLSFSFLKI